MYIFKGPTNFFSVLPNLYYKNYDKINTFIKGTMEQEASFEQKNSSLYHGFVPWLIVMFQIL